MPPLTFGHACPANRSCRATWAFLVVCALATVFGCSYILDATGSPSFIANVEIFTDDFRRVDSGSSGGGKKSRFSSHDDVMRERERELKTTNISDVIKELMVPWDARWMGQAIVNPFPYRFIHNPHKACTGRSVEILIAVPVSRSNFEERQAVRETWGSYANDPDNSAVLLFFLGSDSGRETVDIQKGIDEESNRYSDIVQGQYFDTYRNLSIKSLSILKWVDVYCPQIEFLTKADDDMYIVLPTLVSKLRETSKKSPDQLFILGVEIIGAVPVQDKTSKWYTPKEDFPAKVYPKYASGTSYSMTGKAARLIFQAAIRTRLFWLEDIYITGVCGQKAGVAVIQDWSQTYSKPPANGCQFKKYTTGHRYKVAEIRQIHRELQDKDLKCPPPPPLKVKLNKV